MAPAISSLRPSFLPSLCSGMTSLILMFAHSHTYHPFFLNSERNYHEGDAIHLIILTSQNMFLAVKSLGSGMFILFCCIANLSILATPQALLFGHPQ